MTEQQNPTVSWTKWASLVIIVVIVSVSVTHLAEMNKAVQISVGKERGVTVEVSANDSFAEIFKRALGSDQETVDTILAGKEYYKATNPKLANALRDLDYSRLESQEIANRLRTMLWDLQGPFKIPGTLRGADGRVVAALDDLKETRQEAQASALLAELWKRSLDQEGIFALPILRATVQVVRKAPQDLKVFVFACPGSPLVSGRIMNLYVQDVANLTAEVIQDPSLFDCGGSNVTARELLAKEGKVPLGLSERAFKQLVDPLGGSGIRDGRIDANFVVYPRNLTGVSILGHEGM